MGLRSLSITCGCLHAFLYLASLIALAVLVGHGHVQPGSLTVPLAMLPCMHMAVCVEMAFSASKGLAFGLAAWLAWFALWLPVMTGLLVWLAAGWLAAGGSLQIALAVLSVALLVLLWPGYVVVAMHLHQLRSGGKAKA